MSTTEALDRLISFPTVSTASNLALLDWVEAELAPLAPRFRRFPNADGGKANLLVSIGPNEPGGIVLSGHTDVVPVEGQAWTADPFRLRQDGSRLVGRGATDMKGFVACCIAAAPALAALPLARPVHLALSYDEEVGCTGVGSMAEWIGASGLRPALAVIGEPTRLDLVSGHKGGIIGWGEVTGVPGHSSQPDRYVNAIMAAADAIGCINALRTRMRAGPLDPAFDPPYSTVQVNLIEGGSGKNIVASSCRFFWEMRLLPGTDDLATVAALEAEIRARVEPAMKAVSPDADIRLAVDVRIPGLRALDDRALEARLLGLVGREAAQAVPYGTEAGIFQEAGVPSVVLGPGDIAQAHQPDEFIEADELARCDALLPRLVEAFCA